ncbi:RAMP superfamily CRISPR-associated protein [Plantactinospora sp. WMMC1484]|uniref:RAMP superfamily CRISPR-associated protein n=1 Tax=Plantactinospora sp. WMMC1484 TaxID=3404122 RepID=UPI003BF4E670
MANDEPVRDTDAGLGNGRPFAVEVEFLSDWACGTGTGRHGAVDREVQRDTDGLPMLRGKALAAVLRDAAETVAVGLNDGAIGTWHAWVETVFGSQPGASSRQRLHSGAQFRPQPRVTPVPAVLHARPLRLSAEVRDAIAAFDDKNRVLAREAAVLLRPGVAIDPDRHTAADDTFRIEERAATGLTVTADWQLDFPDLAAGTPVPWEAELLLRAAARLVDAIGGKRRRGAGRCRVTIAGDRAQERNAGDHPRERDADGRPSEPDDGGRPQDHDGGGQGAGEGADPVLNALLGKVDEARSPAKAVEMAAATMTSKSGRAAPAASPLGTRAPDPPLHRHDLRITALTPLLVARGVIGNMVLTEHFVPGTSLLPMVWRALGASATELITGGRVVVTNATVEVDGERSLPVPRALHRPKDTDPEKPNGARAGGAQAGGARADSAQAAGEQAVAAQAHGGQPDGQSPDGGQPGSEETDVKSAELVNLLRPRADDGQRLRPMSGFCVADGDDGIRIAKVDLVAQAHAVVDDASQRPTEDSGGLFVYEAIAAGTVLRCELWLPADAELDVRWLGGEHAIGRSRKDDYGHVRVEVRDPGESPLTTRSTQARTDGGDDGQLVVWLLSDLLLSGPAGEPVTDPAAVGAVLEKQLGVTLTLPEPALEGPPRELVTTRRVESWQRRWSMPRPSLTGLAAGSVIRFQMTGKPDEQALVRVEETGLGERTAEGYGRVALQPGLLERGTIRLPSPYPQPNVGKSAGPATEPAAGPATEPATRKLATAGLPALAVELLRRGWRRELHRTAAVRAASAELRHRFVPPDATAAQLGTLRTLAGRLTAAGGPEQMRSWIAATARSRPRREIWGKDRLNRLTALTSGASNGSGPSGGPGADGLWNCLAAHPPAGLAAELHPAAAGWLLAEVVRAEVEQRRNRPMGDEPVATRPAGARS